MIATRCWPGPMDEETNDQSATSARVGATTDLPHDRITLARFREAFPRARWSDRLNAWFVPGRTAQKRISRWLAAMEAEADRFADEKGRDAFAFDSMKAAISRRRPPHYRFRRPIHVRSSTRSGKFRTHAGTPIAGYGPSLTARSMNSGGDGPRSRRRPSAVSRKHAGPGAKQSRERKKTRHPRRG